MYANESPGERFPPLKTNESSWLSGYPISPQYTCDVPNVTSFIPDIQATYPEYLNDISLLHCPSSPNNVTEGWHYDSDPAKPVDPCHRTNDCFLSGQVDSYIYFGWTILAEHLVQAGADANANPPDGVVNNLFFSTMFDQILTSRYIDTEPNNSQGVYDKDYSYQDNDPGATERTLYRFREGVERFMVTDINDPAATAMAQSSLPVMWDRIAVDISRDGFNHLPGGSNVLYFDGHVGWIRYPGEHPITRVFASVISSLYDGMCP